MQPLRLLVVATAMVALLALVAGLAATNDRVERGRTTTTRATPPSTAPSKELEADVPAKKPIEMRVGDTVTLNVTIPELDTLTLEAFGLDESIAANVPTPVIVTAITAGRFPLKLEDSGTSIGELVVKPALPAGEQPAEPAPEKPSTPETAPATAAQGPAVGAAF
ncbi:hypothetical protein [Patulibacter minatonensis]|uniref:hypothetical protein n=1 Tax=Patulibacter minatonensis TaxID=298163 RepID=UPI000479B1E6|nr:hypothetical protein [Patulibacter minatonensis]